MGSRMIASFLIPLGFLIAGIAFGIVAAIEWRTQKKLVEQGVVTEAKLIDRSITSIRGGKVYSITSRYWHEGKSYERSSTISKEKYDSLAVGKRVSIRYLPDHPSTARIEGERAMFAAFVVSIALVGLALALFIAALTVSLHS